MLFHVDSRAVCIWAYGSDAPYNSKSRSSIDLNSVALPTNGKYFNNHGKMQSLQEVMKPKNVSVSCRR